MVIITASLTGAAQNYHYKYFNRFFSKENQSISNIRKIAEDKFGFIWMATQDGLFKFDGKKFIEFNKGVKIKKRSITGSDVRDIVIKGDYLWCVNSFGGIDCIDILTASVVYSWHQSSNSKLKNTLLHSFMLVNNDLIIAGDDGLYIFDTKIKKIRQQSLTDIHNKSLRNTYINKTCITTNNDLWVFIKQQGVFVYESETYRLKYRLRNEELSYFDCQLIGKNIVAATNSGIKIFSIQHDTIFIKSSNLKNANKVCYAISIDSFNKIWYTTPDGLFALKMDFSEEIQILESKVDDNKSWTGLLYELFYDSEKRLWVGGQDGLAVSAASQPPFVAFKKSTRSNIQINHSYFLFPFRDSVVYVCAEDGLYKVNITNGIIESVHTGLSFFYMLEDPNGNLMVSNTDGLFILKKNKLMPVSNVYREFSNDNIVISSHSLIDSKTFILGTQNEKGFYIWNPEVHSLKHINENDSVLSLNKGVVNQIFVDKKKIVWLLGDNYIIQFDPKTQRYSYKKIVDNIGNAYSIFFDICQVRNNYYLASYGNGIIVIDSNFKVVNRISVENGLSNNGVYKIFSHDDSLVFVSTNNGLSVINTLNNSVKRYYSNYGLHSNSFEELSGNQSLNSIFMGGKDGFTLIKPDLLKDNFAAPKIYFGSLEIKTNEKESDTLDFNLHTLYISNAAVKADIFFTAINWNNPEEIIYSYRITEKSNEWIDLGSQNFISLIGTPPGTYHLQVKAANEDGVWSEPKELILVFLPKWYQTWWFYLLIALTVAAILYALYRYRISQIKKQHEIRKNIATDLHDDLGSTLNSVKVFTNLAISGVKQEESLQQVKDNLTEATMSLRDMIWVLDDSLDTVDELITRLKQFAIPVAAASNIEAIIKADSDVNSRQLTKEEKRNLFLICKEAINNSIKYSGATQIDVSITASGKKIQIAVADNGKGFNVDEVKKGYGLKNMQYRAGQIKYKVALVSSEGKGTKIEIKPD